MSNRSSRRKEMDFMKLMNNPAIRVYPSDTVSEFWVELQGPRDSPYEDGVWAVHVVLPADYPFKSPSIGFSNRIFHPNIDEASGSVCLDVINQTWTPMYELHNIFEVFLPQLLRYPNPSDPLNPSAAALHDRDSIAYVTHVQEHVAMYATREVALRGIPAEHRKREGDAEEEMAESDETQEMNRYVMEARKAELQGNSPATSRGLTDTPPSPMCSAREEEYNPEDIDI